MIRYAMVIIIPDCRLSGSVFSLGAGGLRFNSRVSQIGHSIASGLPLLRASNNIEAVWVARAQ